jgi:hypothetical protein
MGKQVENPRCGLETHTSGAIIEFPSRRRFNKLNGGFVLGKAF